MFKLCGIWEYVLRGGIRKKWAERGKDVRITRRSFPFLEVIWGIAVKVVTSGFSPIWIILFPVTAQL